MPIVDWTDFKLFFHRRRQQRRQQVGDGVVIGQSHEGGSVRWPSPSNRSASHALVLGASGSGKSIMVADALVAEFLQQRKRESIVTVDPKGDLVRHMIQALAATQPKRLSDVAYLNPFREGFAYNLIINRHDNTEPDIRAYALAGLVNNLSSNVGTQHIGTGSRQQDVLFHLILATLASSHSQASILWALDALVIPNGLKKLARITKSDRARQFLNSVRLSPELASSTASRLRTAFAMTSRMERIISADSCIDFKNLLSPGKLVLVDLGQPSGGLSSLTQFWSNLLVRNIIDLLLARPSMGKQHHVRIVIDEAQVVAPVLADVAERVLTTGRSLGVSLTTMSQGTTLINEASRTLLRTLLTNAPFRVIGRLAAQDAELLSKEQAPMPGIDIPLGQLRSEFAASVCNLSDREFFSLSPQKRIRFRSRDVDMIHWNKAETRHNAQIEALKARYGLPEPSKPRVTLDKPFDARPLASKNKKKPASSVRSPWG